MCVKSSFCGVACAVTVEKNHTNLEHVISCLVVFYCFPHHPLSSTAVIINETNKFSTAVQQDVHAQGKENKRNKSTITLAVNKTHQAFNTTMLFFAVYYSFCWVFNVCFVASTGAKVLSLSLSKCWTQVWDLCLLWNLHVGLDYWWPVCVIFSLFEKKTSIFFCVVVCVRNRH